MPHLNDKLAEFFYGELSSSEMAGARRHVSECSECRLKVDEFERTHLTLMRAPDVDPPYRIVFGRPERPSWSSRFDWRWLAPGSAATALVIAVVAVAIAMSPAPGPVVISASTPAPVVVQARDIDYNRILSELRQSERLWLAGELDKRDKEIQRLRGELAYYDNLQRSVWRETMENASSIQLLAQRSPSED